MKKIVLEVRNLTKLRIDLFYKFLYNNLKKKYFCRGGINMMKGLDVAKYIVDKCCKEGKAITNLHLQKILYFVQGEYFHQTGKFLIEDDFLAWKYGPVLNDVYEEYRWYYSARIYETHDEIEISQYDRDIIDPVIEEKRSKTVGKLIAESHKTNGAWDRCYNGDKNTIISKMDIKKDFS